jgi:ferredoxin
MKGTDFSSHFICTLPEAGKIIAEKNLFWVSNCGCRESGKGCGCSRLDVCLFFTPDSRGTGTNLREVGRDFVDGILKEAQRKHLVSRPFADKEDPKKIQGICFCCSDCCAFFQNPHLVCAKGVFHEKTNHKACISCGTCVDVCYFNAREIRDGELVENLEQCFGCGLCADVCPMHCIVMSPLKENDKSL